MQPPGQARWRVVVPSLVALLALVHWPLFVGRAVIVRDARYWLTPARAVVRAALLTGHLPRWNPFVGLGLSVPAEPLYGLFYPPHWPTLLAADVAWGASLDAWLHLLLGALGCAALVVRLGARTTGAVVAGAAWSLSGPMQSEWSGGARLFGNAWLPWCALAAWSLAHTPPGKAWARAVLAAAVPVGMALLAGEPFIAAFGALGGGAMVLTAPRPALPRALLGWSLAVGIGALLALPTLLPMLAGAAGSQRAAPLTRAVAEQLSMHPWRLADVGVLGGVGLAWSLGVDPALDAFMDPYPLLESLYLGAAVLLLAALGLGRDRARVALAALAALGLFVALGRYTPAHAVFRWVVLPFRYMRSPEKYVALTTFAVAALAGLGADRVLRERRAVLLAAAAMAAAYALLWATSRGWMPRGLAMTVPRGALQGIVCAAALAAVAGRPRVAAVAVVALVVADLGVNIRSFDRWGDGERLREAPPLVAAMRALAPRGVIPRVYRTDALVRVQPRNVHAAAFVRATLHPNTGGLFGLATVPGYDVGVAPETLALVARRRIDALRVLSVDAALMPTMASPAGLERIADIAPGATLYRVLATLPRAYVAPEGRALADDAARAQVLDAAVVRGDRVLLSGPVGGGAAAARGECRTLRGGDGEREAECDAPAGGWAVFVEQWAPGWHATVDGAAAGPVLRANLTGLAVRLSASPRPQRVRVRFEPPGVTAGATAGALAWAALGLAGWRLRRRSGGAAELS